MKKLILSAVLGFCILGASPVAWAVPIFLNAATVTSVDRSATFDSLTSNNIDLTAYTEGTLTVTVPDINFQGFSAFTPGDPRTPAFHYGSGGNFNFVTIRDTDSVVFHAMQFLLGDGTNNSTTDLRWETFLLGVSTGTSLEAGLGRGTTVGWTDVVGFDELRVAALAGLANFGDNQAIALDDVLAQTAPLAPQAVPEIQAGAAGIPLALLAGALALVYDRRRLAWSHQERVRH